jgi:chromosome partitioning protein
MPATVIGFINQKGGCGKSSCCFHLGGQFARDGLRVLLVDADPQGSLSQGFFGSAFVEALPLEATLAACFEDSANILPWEHIVQPTPFERLYIVCSNQSLASHNVPNPEVTGMQQFALTQFLADIPNYDIVLIDCPPNLYQCSWNALLAANWIVIPVPPEDFGTQGLRVIHEGIEQAQKLNPSLQLLGHLVTRFDSRLLIHRRYEGKLRQLYGAQVMETVIPEASAFKVSLACRQPVPYFSSRTAAARLTSQLSREILDRIAGQTNKANVG